MAAPRRSPNHDARPVGAAIDCLVLHYTGMETGEAALARLCDPAAKVSAHYLVFEDGRVAGLVDEGRRAWHAGVSRWQGRGSLNDASVGIEIVNPGHGHGYRPFPERQMAAVVELCGDIGRRYGIVGDRVVGHSDVAPGRKIDPGEKFDWRRLGDLTGWHEPLAERPWGSGIPFDADVAAWRPDAAEARRLLGAIGYGVGEGEAGLRTALAAFQRHFRPRRVDGRLDRATEGQLRGVAATFGRG